MTLNCLDGEKSSIVPHYSCSGSSQTYIVFPAKAPFISTDQCRQRHGNLIARHGEKYGKLIKIDDLGDSKYKLKPIQFYLTIEEGEYNGYYKSLGIYTLCDTIPEITDEIKRDILDLYEDLSQTPDSQLGDEPRRWKKHLNEIIST